MNLQEQLNTERRKVQDALAVARAVRNDESAVLVFLKRAVEHQEKVAALAIEVIASYEACRTCGRKVRSPCHDAVGYHTEGPWDFLCAHFISGRDEG